MTEGRPMDSEFKKHFEALLNPEGLEELELEHVYSNVHVPVLDNQIEPLEIDHVIKHQLKFNKGCGPDGLRNVQTVTCSMDISPYLLVECCFYCQLPRKLALC